MGFDTYASVFVGAELSVDEAMEVFGAKYVDDIRDVCPKDNVPNPDKKAFCADCGTELKNKKKVTEGVEYLNDIEDLDSVKNLGLEVQVLDEDSYGKKGVMIGKELIGSDSISEGGEVLPLEYNATNLVNLVQSLQDKLPKVGVNQPVKMYLITMASA